MYSSIFNIYPAYSARHPFDVQLNLAVDINSRSFGGGTNKYKQASSLARARRSRTSPSHIRTPPHLRLKTPHNQSPGQPHPPCLDLLLSPGRSSSNFPRRGNHPPSRTTQQPRSSLTAATFGTSAQKHGSSRKMSQSQGPRLSSLNPVPRSKCDAGH